MVAKIGVYVAENVRRKGLKRVPSEVPDGDNAGRIASLDEGG